MCNGGLHFKMTGVLPPRPGALAIEKTILGGHAMFTYVGDEGDRPELKHLAVLFPERTIFPELGTRQAKLGDVIHVHPAWADYVARGQIGNLN